MGEAVRPAARALRATWRWSPRAAVPAILVGAGYFAGSLAGFALRLPESGISFLWPPTAILTAALLLAPPRAWASYVAASLIAHCVAHVEDGLPMAMSLALFAPNGVQALLAAFLMRRYSRRSPLFRDLHSVMVFILGASMVAPAVAAAMGSFIYLELGWSTDFFHAWWARLLSNFIASLTIVPPVVMTVQQLRSGHSVTLKRVIQFVALLGAMIVTFHLTAEFWPQGAPGVPLALYLPIPFLLWAAVRFGPAELSGALLCTTLLTVTSALRG